MISPHKHKRPQHLPRCSGRFLLLELSFNLFGFFILDPDNLDICSFSNVYFIFNYVCMCNCVLVCAHSASASGGRKKHQIPLELLWQTVWDPHVDTGNWAQVLCRRGTLFNSEHLPFSEHLLFSHCSKVAKMLVPEPAWCWGSRLAHCTCLWLHQYFPLFSLSHCWYFLASFKFKWILFFLNNFYF